MWIFCGNFPYSPEWSGMFSPCIHTTPWNLPAKVYILSTFPKDAFSVTWSYLTLCDPLDCNPPDSSVHESFQARVMKCIAISCSRGSSQHWEGSALPKDNKQFECGTHIFVHHCVSSARHNAWHICWNMNEWIYALKSLGKTFLSGFIFFISPLSGLTCIKPTEYTTPKFTVFQMDYILCYLYAFTDPNSSLQNFPTYFLLIDHSSEPTLFQSQLFQNSLAHHALGPSTCGSIYVI